MFCRNCGKTLNPREIFCGNCGIKIENQNNIINNINANQTTPSTNYNVNQQQINPIQPTQQTNQVVTNNLDNQKKDNKAKLIVGIILTVIGIGMTMGTFFFFGPFLGFMFLIPGAILLFSAIFSKNKMSTKILLNIILTIVLCVVVIFISVLIWQKEDNIDNNVDNSNENIIEENTNQEENIETDKRVGSDEFGYITIPNNWSKFIDVSGNNTLQYSYANIYIATLYAVPTTKIDAYNYASNVMNNLENQGVQNIQGATVNIGKYTAYQVYGYYINENIWLVCWFFEAEDGKTHYISIEGPDPNSEYFNIPDTFSLNK